MDVRVLFHRETYIKSIHLFIIFIYTFANIKHNFDKPICLTKNRNDKCIVRNYYLPQILILGVFNIVLMSIGCQSYIFFND